MEQLATIERKREEDIGLHRRRADESDNKAREVEHAATAEARRSKHILDQIKDKYSTTMQQVI